MLVIESMLPPLVSQADPHLESDLVSDLNMLAVTGGGERNETNGEHFSKQRVFVWPQFFRSGMMGLDAKPA